MLFEKKKKRQQGEKRDSTAKVIISKCMYLNTTHVSTIYSLFWNLDYDKTEMLMTIEPDHFYEY